MMSLYSPKPQLRRATPVSSQEVQAALLNQRFDEAGADDVLRHALTSMGRMALVSSFGAESVVLLHMVSQIDRHAPVLFIDTEMLFPETLDYQRQVTEQLGLTGVLIFRAGDSAVVDPHRDLHEHDKDACCNLRKTQPLQTALTGYDGWITGRKRYQSGTRVALDYFEAEAGTNRIKVNPLARWQSEDLRGYLFTHDLPSHPLVSKGYPSIGCAPCTSPVAEGEDPRAGRWRGEDKDECGIHFENGKLVRRSAQ